jgi:hypothetical protein
MKNSILYSLIIPFFSFTLATPSVSGQPVTGIDTISTINSFQAVGEFYTMDYSGDYNALLDWMDDLLTGKDLMNFEDFKCSLFNANGDMECQLFGRNFDNPETDVLIARFQPPDGYFSLAFTRMNDLGYTYGTNFNNLTFIEKLALLNSAYFPPDGINEHGLAAGLAYVDPVSYSVDPSKDTIFVTRLIREILDHASSIDEAIAIANNFNVWDNYPGNISHHLLVGLVEGESVTLEFHDGEFKTISSDSSWQVLTNIPVYNVPHQQLMNSCWRYNSLYTTLEDNNGILDWSEGMDALEDVHMNCPWSTIYDLNNNGIYVAVHNNFEDIAYTDLEDFGFIVYVGFNESLVVNHQSLVTVFPNPISGVTSFGFRVTGSEHVTLKIYDLQGREVAMVVNKELPAGEHMVSFDVSGLPAGIYIYKKLSEAKSGSGRTEISSQKSAVGKLVKY